MHCFRFDLSEQAKRDGIRQLDMRANWGLTVMPIRHSDKDLVQARVPSIVTSIVTSIAHPLRHPLWQQLKHPMCRLLLCRSCWPSVASPIETAIVPWSIAHPMRQPLCRPLCTFVPSSWHSFVPSTMTSCRPTPAPRRGWRSRCQATRPTRHEMCEAARRAHRPAPPCFPQLDQLSPVVLCDVDTNRSSIGEGA